MSAGNRKIWQGLVDYVNTDNLESNTKALIGFAITVSKCMPWLVRNRNPCDVPTMAVLQGPREVLRNLSVPFLENKKASSDPARQQALEYQPQVRRLLTWLADREHSGDGTFARSFLFNHMKHIHFDCADLLRYLTAVGDSKRDLPRRTFSYEDQADGICDFVLREHEAGRDMPVRLCKRPECGKLVAHFKKREYCRTAECDRERQKRDTDLKLKKDRDSVFLHRVRTIEKAALRRKKVRESAERLRHICDYWQDISPSLSRHASRLLQQL